MRFPPKPSCEYAEDEQTAGDRETEATVRWMMDALVDAALRQAK